MPEAKIFTSKGFEDTAASFLARIVGNSGANIVSADIAGITYSVYDLTTEAQVVSGSLTPAENIYDALKTAQNTTGFANLWTLDSTGYNFRVTMVGSAFPNGPRCYRLVFRFDPVTGEDFPLVFTHETIRMFEA